MTAEELRRRILDVTFANGGHLASSLGAVEIALALSQVFDPVRDRIVWDVGHQSYAWKILTGRDDSFDTLRRFGGISGFPNPQESPADAAVAGHAGVAISVAEGLAAAHERLADGAHVVAVVGDAAIANGSSFEALNNCTTACGKVIVVLNDNEMSISRPTGALARLFGRLVTGVRYNRVKLAAENAGHRMRLTFLRGLYHRLESCVKGLFVGSAFFERFGLRYIGPIDGHDLAALKRAFSVAREDKRSVLVHVVTKKGRGYAPAEQDPTKWHGIGPQRKGDAKGSVRTWSDAFGEALAARARQDGRLVALTAGMKTGVGLQAFAAEFPQRFFDVGISEGHMVSFAAGLAAGGLRPVVAVYSTFLQRAVDQVMHDVCLSNLPVVFCVDRAGVVGTDGITHQGLYDLAMLRCLPNLTICQPKDEADLHSLLEEAFARPGPTVIRYPRGPVPRQVEVTAAGNGRGSESLPDSSSAPVFSFWATGDQLEKAQRVAAAFPGSEVIHARYLKPFDAGLLARQRAAGKCIVSLENAAVAGGFGEAIGADIRFGWPDSFIPHGTVGELERAYGLDVDAIVARLRAQNVRKDC